MNQSKLIAAPVSAAIGYAIGNFNPSYLVGKMKGYDVRESGTGNAGASNTFMLAGKTYGVLVALADIFKAAGAGWLSKALFPQARHAGSIGSTAAQLGHMFPVLLGFKGGKGFACMGGTVLAYDPKMLLKLFGVAVAIGFGTGYIAIATLCMSIIWPITYYFTTGDRVGTAILLFPAIPIFIRHIPNLQRIARGEEARMMNVIWRQRKELERIGGLHLAPMELRIKRGYV